MKVIHRKSKVTHRVVHRKLKVIHRVTHRVVHRVMHRKLFKISNNINGLFVFSIKVH
jgi:hypothetical protein